MQGSLEYTLHTYRQEVMRARGVYKEGDAWSVALDWGTAFAMASAGIEGPGEDEASLASSARRATALNHVRLTLSNSLLPSTFSFGPGSSGSGQSGICVDLGFVPCLHKSESNCQGEDIIEGNRGVWPV